MDLRHLMAVLRAWLPLLVASAVLAGVAAYAVSGALPRSYKAKATLIVGQSLSTANPDYNQLLVSQRLSATYAALATTRPVLERVIAGVGLTDLPEELVKRVDAEAPLDSTLLTISAEDVDPARAAAIANALAGEIIAASPALQGRAEEFEATIDADLTDTLAQIQRADAQLAALYRLTKRTEKQEASLETLEARLASLRSSYAALRSYSSGSVANLLTVVEPAVPPREPSWPRPLLNTALAAILGLLIACGLALLVDYLDDSIKDADAVEEVSHLSTLGVIGRMAGGRGRREMYRLAALMYPKSGIAEAYRTLRANVEFASVDAPLRTLLVTSSIPGEGKTVTAANLAIVFAQSGRRVILVDADMRQPAAHVLFDLDNAEGLSTLLRSESATVDDVAHETEVANLRVVTTGPQPPNPAELVGSRRMREVLERVRDAADIVIIDSAPLQPVTDAAILSAIVDGTLVVIDARRTRRRAVRASTEVLARAGAHVIGVVLNRARVHVHSGAYSAYYGGYVGAESTKDRHATPATKAQERADAPAGAHRTG